MVVFRYDRDPTCPAPYVAQLYPRLNSLDVIGLLDQPSVPVARFLAVPRDPDEAFDPTECAVTAGPPYTSLSYPRLQLSRTLTCINVLIVVHMVQH